MARKIIHTNPHLKTVEDRVKRVSKSVVDSHKIEGIDIPMKDAMRFVRNAMKKDSSTMAK